ncbi:MAG: ribosome small subunit-dependent GTPase A [Candidatus Pacebacteria bacterium]|nr:ribosome small subunit-dependent GTPase A [Candidatus Paceibacterota bacterium]
MFDEKKNIVICSIPGKLKNQYLLKNEKQYIIDIAAVGDTVKFKKNKDGTGVIVSIEERINYFSRKAPRIKGASYRGERLEQIISANIDNLVVITSVQKPNFNNKLLDRIIVAGESSHINITIVINKSDLQHNEEVSDWIKLYESLGYNIYLTSVVNGKGVKPLRENLSGRTNLFCGQSGVGKSSLLNLLYPQLKLKIGEISDSTQKGTHTTVTALLEEVEDKTTVIDTPGIREFESYGIKKEDLGHYFVEFLPFINECKFNTCTHFHEPGCAVVSAVSECKISEERYNSYLNLLDSIEDDMIF